MYCFHPILVKQWKELPDGSHFRTNNFHYVPCGKCVACLSRKRNEMTYRLNQEQLYSSYSYFLTLTYDQENMPIKMQDNIPYFVFNKKHVQDYLKRCRYYMGEMNKDLKFSYFCVSEYGAHTHRPHYHMLVFVKNDKFLKYKNTIFQIMHSNWKHGFSVVKPTNQANIHYCTKYCLKNLEDLPNDCIDPVFSLSSKRPYLGAAAEEKLEFQYGRHVISDRMDPVVFNNGMRNVMPRIYRTKLGLSGYGSAMSDDPRLTQDQFDEWYREFNQNNDIPEGVDKFEKFTIFCNKKFSLMERIARQRQLQRSEKF